MLEGMHLLEGRHKLTPGRWPDNMIFFSFLIDKLICADMLRAKQARRPVRPNQMKAGITSHVQRIHDVSFAVSTPNIFAYAPLPFFINFADQLHLQMYWRC